MSRPGRTVAAAFVALVSLVVAPAALALDCPNVPLDERLQAAEVAFVGRLTDERPAADGRSVRSARMPTARAARRRP